MTEEQLQKFYARIRITPGCWWWLGARQQSNGYGRFGYGRGREYAHILSYRLYKGEIPKGLFVRHRCDNPLCINPEHLLIGTQKDNMQDAKQRNRTAKGEANGRSKLSAEEVRQIYDLAHCKLFTQQEIANWYNCVQANVSFIKSGWSRSCDSGALCTDTRSLP